MSRDIVFLYDQVIESMARLHAFDAVKIHDWPDPTNDVEDDLDDFAEIMARRDLLTFAASARNFAEACEAAGEMRAVTAATCKLLSPPKSPFFIETPETITLYQVLSRLLHSTKIRICKYSDDYHELLTSIDAFLQLAGNRQGQVIERSETLVIIQSEKEPFTAVRLRSLLLKACDFLNAVSDRLSAENKIFLQRSYREL
ncbi:hypothetical protein RX327_20070 [Bradyrhizobium sp. BEA-2-5]|uniref:hypothetical protein n=1 Tax=Bradyrhizobium sp. BEA-2-5 TaxID=3080015 RepID=UPI00293F57CE|nr:hypothetical protein [Bradyrhizobium sp. BEA-2-5]WOH78266.1 hypothetical protein RX327_20070 [Bradyrhizobium sp. BEA-2-5]